MTIRDTLGRVFQPGLIADIPTGNLLWVDAVNGNDDLAVRGRMTVPFKTLTKAKEAAKKVGDATKSAVEKAKEAVKKPTP